MSQKAQKAFLDMESIARDVRDDAFHTAIVKQSRNGKPLDWNELQKIWEETDRENNQRPKTED